MISLTTMSFFWQLAKVFYDFLLWQTSVIFDLLHACLDHS